MLPYQTIPQKEEGIAIVGIGGAGANILQCFSGSSADNVRLCTMSLDERVGRACGSNMEFIQLGGGLNHGLGSGGDPEVGRAATVESSSEISTLLNGVRLLVIVAGLGGGTGSGAAPVLAQMARDAGIFLVSVVLMPFAFEGRRRRAQAEKALEEVSRVSDIVYCFENDYMEELFRNQHGARAVFEEVDRLLAKATASVPMLASSPGLINLGLDELATALANNDSRCLFGSGSGYGPRRAETAAQAAIDSPLVSFHDAIRYARTVIVHLAGGDSMSLTEIRQAMEVVRSALADDDVSIFFGTTIKKHLGDEMRVTIIASIDAAEFKAMIDAPPPAPARVAPEPSTPVTAASYPVDSIDTLTEAEENHPAPVPSDDVTELAEEQEDVSYDKVLQEEIEEPSFESLEEEEEELPSTPLEQGKLMMDDLPGFSADKGQSESTQTDVEKRLRNLFPDDEDTPQPQLTAHRNIQPSDPVLEARVRHLFPEDENDNPSAIHSRSSSIDSSLRFNDLRDMFES